MAKTTKYPLQAEETETLAALIEAANPTNDDILKVRAYYKIRDAPNDAGNRPEIRLLNNQEQATTAEKSQDKKP